MLSPSNPVLHFAELLLFEDELADRGYSESSLRYRVMKDCWFVLLRSYLRIDKVTVRILDTRLFHKFGDNLINRDFMHREESWENLEKEMPLGSEWLLSPTQSDEVYEHLPIVLHTKDNIQF